MHIPNLLGQAEFSDTGPNKKIIYDAPEMRAVLFSLKGGQEVTPHVVSSEVVMYAASGEGSFRVGSGVPEVGAGSLVVCKPNEAHGIAAKSDMVALVAVVPGRGEPPLMGGSNVIDVKGAARCSEGAFAPNIAYVSPAVKLPIICLMPGQEIPPHPSATGMFYVVSGRGVFTVGEEKVEVSAGSFVIAPSGTVRGIKSVEKLILFAVHAGMH